MISTSMDMQSGCPNSHREGGYLFHPQEPNSLQRILAPKNSGVAMAQNILQLRNADITALHLPTTAPIFFQELPYPPEMDANQLTYPSICSQ